MEPQKVFEFLEKWSWAAFILVTFLNAATFALRGRRQIQVHPELRDGYSSIIRGFVTWGNLPWVVMGIGCVYGGVPSVFSFFRPRDGDPYVLAFFCSVFLVWALGTYWLLCLGGAQKLVDHPGLLNIEIKSPRGVLVYWFLSLAGGIVATVWMFVYDVPMPHFR
jgi:hypothetical protein